MRQTNTVDEEQLQRLCWICSGWEEERSSEYLRYSARQPTVSLLYSNPWTASTVICLRDLVLVRATHLSLPVIINHTIRKSLMNDQNG